MTGASKRVGLAAATAAVAVWPMSASAQDQAGTSPPLDPIAIAIFLAFVGITVGITRWAARRTHTTDEFYAAGGTISGFQNGLAMAGDYMSAAAFLGISALVFTKGFDGLIYSIGFLVGWPLMVFLIAERLRNLGKYTFADVLSFRLSPKPMRCLSAANSLVVIGFYLIAQMVGAGQLIELLFGLNYVVAMIVVGGLMILYVTFGGMLATTWVQIVKAVLLLLGTFFMATMVLVVFHFDVDALLAKAIAISPQHAAILRPSAAAATPWSTVSLGVALMFGTAGLPHILMRFFTVPDAKQARESVFWAATCVATFSILTFIIGFGAIVLVGGNPVYFDSARHLIGGSNMPAIHLAQAVGGDAFKGFIAAVAFATILAVVSGLTLSCASTISHDLYANVFSDGHLSQGRELAISRLTTPFVGLVAIGLGIAFAKQNVAYMVGLAFAVAASANFPLILLSIYWKGLTTRGAVLGGILGLTSAVGLTILGPGIWVAVLHFKQPLFPLANPALVSVPLAFLGCCFGSLLDPSRGAKADAERFEAQRRASHAGLAPAKASFAPAADPTLSLKGSAR